MLLLDTSIIYQKKEDLDFLHNKKYIMGLVDSATFLDCCIISSGVSIRANVEFISPSSNQIENGFHLVIRKNDIHKFDWLFNTQRVCTQLAWDIKFMSCDAADVYKRLMSVLSLENKLLMELG